ncbi:MAG: hypothetical protein L7W43_15170 [Rubripirellula sp.]|nr:hypothetical protein [Rubripirellula sp.]
MDSQLVNAAFVPASIVFGGKLLPQTNRVTVAYRLLSQIATKTSKGFGDGKKLATQLQPQNIH